ncbi:hypothetical protein [Nonomuraea angiospora]
MPLRGQKQNNGKAPPGHGRLQFRDNNTPISPRGHVAPSKSDQGANDRRTRGPIGVSSVKQFRDQLDEFVRTAWAVIGAIGFIGVTLLLTIAGLIALWHYLFS